MSFSILNNIPAQRAIRTLESNLAGIGAAAGALSSGDRLQDPAQKVQASDEVELSGQPQATSILDK